VFLNVDASASGETHLSLSHCRGEPSKSSAFVAALIIPTGIGASQGGYAGDATPWLNLLASCCDVLVTHPNVANAASFQQLPENALYVEGFALDGWLQQRHTLRPLRRPHTLGLVMDAGIETGMKVLHHNVVRAMASVYGLRVLPPKETRDPLQTRLVGLATGGASSGELMNPEVLLEAAEALLQEGATAIALATHLEEPEGSTYQAGIGPDPIGGLEALLSHTVVQQLGVPCANAPVFSEAAAMPVTEKHLEGKVAAEYITATFLPSVLLGLRYSPELGSCKAMTAEDLPLSALQALVLPYDAMGGIPTLAALEQAIPLIAVRSNQTVLNFPLEKLIGSRAVQALQSQGLYYEAHSYTEAAGYLQGLRLGLYGRGATLGATLS
jgi:Protein of unknown function (DUF3326)